MAWQVFTKLLPITITIDSLLIAFFLFTLFPSLDWKPKKSSSSTINWRHLTHNHSIVCFHIRWTRNNRKRTEGYTHCQAGIPVITFWLDYGSNQKSEAIRRMYGKPASQIRLTFKSRAHHLLLTRWDNLKPSVLERGSENKNQSAKKPNHATWQSVLWVCSKNPINHFHPSAVALLPFLSNISILFIKELICRSRARN